jgi:hypothetical protein
MCEVNQFNDAVHHGVAQGDQCVHAAQNQAIDDLLEKDIDGVPPKGAGF